MASFTNTQYCLRSSSGLNGRLRLFILYVLDCGDFKDDVWISPFNLRPHCKHLNNRKMVKSLHSLEESCITADMWSAVGGSEYSAECQLVKPSSWLLFWHPRTGWSVLWRCFLTVCRFCSRLLRKRAVQQFLSVVLQKNSERQIHCN